MMLKNSPTAEVTALKYRIKAVEQEKLLLEASKDEEINTLNKKWLAVNQQYQEASSSQTFLYNENVKLAEKLRDVEAKSKATYKAQQLQIEELHWTVSQLKEQLLSKDQEVESLANTNSVIGSKLKGYENQRRHLRDELQEQLRNVLGDNTQLNRKIQDLEAELLSVKNSSSRAELAISTEDLNVLNKNLIRQSTENTQLKSQLLVKQLEIKDLKSDAMLIKLLEEEKKSLKSTIQTQQASLSAQYSQINELVQENISLKHDKEQFFVLLDGQLLSEKSTNDKLFQYSSGKKLVDFIQLYNSFSSQHSRDQSKIDFLKAELNDMKTIFEDQAKTINDLNIKNNELTGQVELQKQESIKFVNEIHSRHSEIQLLLLKINRLEEFNLSFKDFATKHSSSKKDTEDNTEEKTENTNSGIDQASILAELDSKNKQIAGLEEALDQYVKNLEQQKNSNEQNKRQKLDNGSKRSSIVDSENKLLNKYHDEILKLRKEIVNLEELNSELVNDSKTYQHRVEKLQAYIDNLPKIKEEQEHPRILELFNNPVRDYQRIKAETLDVLKKENSELLKRLEEFSKKDTSSSVDSLVTLIPKSVLDRYMVQVEHSEKEIETLNKKLDRLKKVYGQKSAEVIKTISLLFGFGVEFFADSKKVKIKPKQYGALEKKTDNNNYLVIDLFNKALQISNSSTEEFSKKCESLINYWVKTKGEIPCFLSALNLELFEYDQLGK